jgi:purine-binding chemotaxis protein CheW
VPTDVGAPATGRPGLGARRLRGRISLRSEIVHDPDAGLSLFCRVRTRLCALPIEHVLETMRPLPIEPLAGAPAFVSGLAIIRGSPVPVVDAARLLGAGEGRPARFVTLQTGGRRVALAVDGVVGVGTIPERSSHDLPPILGDVAAEFVAAIGTLDADLLLVLRAARLVPEGVWEVLDAKGPPA